MATYQLSATNVSLTAARALMPSIPSTNVSLSAIESRFLGSSTAYSSVSNVSMWFVDSVKKSLSPTSDAPYTPGSGAVNPTRDRSSAAYTGWVYSGAGQPWNPTKMSELRYAAQAVPALSAIGIGTGDYTRFTLRLAGYYLDASGGTSFPVVSTFYPATSSYYVWIQSTTASIGPPRWHEIPSNPGYLQFSNCSPGEYFIWIQDYLGCGNQFDFQYKFTYPAPGVTSSSSTSNGGATGGVNARQN